MSQENAWSVRTSRVDDVGLLAGRNLRGPAVESRWRHAQAGAGGYFEFVRRQMPRRTSPVLEKKTRNSRKDTKGRNIAPLLAQKVQKAFHPWRQVQIVKSSRSMLRPSKDCCQETIAHACNHNHPIEEEQLHLDCASRQERPKCPRKSLTFMSSASIGGPAEALRRSCSRPWREQDDIMFIEDHVYCLV